LEGARVLSGKSHQNNPGSPKQEDEEFAGEVAGCGI
jgi:hypothetical protein